jgi:hypothetical protein
VTIYTPAGQITADGYLYFSRSNNYDKQLDIYDLSDPIYPSYVATYQALSFVGWPETIQDVAMQDQFVYLLNEECGGHTCNDPMPFLEVVDVSNPLTPTLAGRTIAMYGLTLDSVKVSGHYAFLFGSEAVIYDITDPFAPTFVQSFPNEWLNVNPVDIAAAGDYLYVAGPDGQGYRMYIIDYSDPAAPVLLGSYTNVNSVNIVSGYLYGIESGLGRIVHVFDISDPATPIEVNVYDHPQDVEPPLYGPLIIEGSYAYIGGNVLDISDPTNPVLVGFHPLQGEWAVEGQYSYVVQDSGGWDAGNWYALKQTPVMVSLSPNLSSSLTYTHYQYFPTRFDFPAGSVSEPITITVNASTAEDIAGFSFARHTFGLSAVQGETVVPNYTFAAPVTVTLHYSPDDVKVISNEEELALWVWTEAGWQDAAATCAVPAGYERDTLKNLLTVTICETGRFALFGPTHQRYLPFIEQH